MGRRQVRPWVASIFTIQPSLGRRQPSPAISLAIATTTMIVVKAFSALTAIYRSTQHYPIVRLLGNSAEEIACTSTPSDEFRQTLLNDKLLELGIEPDSLQQAARQTISDPLSGYEASFGRSAIRAYRSFLYPKKGPVETNSDKLTGMAIRAAQQIEFLIKRHRSHREEWVRHHDTGTTTREKVFPMIVLLDNLRSAFNVGSIFRTADATGCSMVVTTGITPHPQGNGAEKIARSALGAEISVPSRHFKTTKEAIEYFRQEQPNYTIVGLETTEQSLCYTDFKFPSDGVVIVLGNEVTGVDTEIMPLLDTLVEIPMFGTKNSLNVASCASITLYEIVRQWT